MSGTNKIPLDYKSNRLLAFDEDPPTIVPLANNVPNFAPDLVACGILLVTQLRKTGPGWGATHHGRYCLWVEAASA